MRHWSMPSPGRRLRLAGNQEEWPLALRFALYVIPAGLCLVLAATWVGYQASSTVLRDSLEAVPLLEAKIQAGRMSESLNQLQHSLQRIAQQGAPDLRDLRENLPVYFQDNEVLIQEIGYKDNNGAGFMLLRNGGGFEEISVAEASQGPYSPFQQLGALTLRPGAATLYPPVSFYAPGRDLRDPEQRVPVIRMALQQPDGSGVLVLGIGLAQWRNKLASFMQQNSSPQDRSLQLSFFFDPRGWILFEMTNSGNKNYVPDLARAGYNGDLGRAGFDAAFRPWAVHENYWRMVKDVEAGRAGSASASADKYASVPVGATGYLCYAPVYFTPAEDASPIIAGGVAFFTTSTLPLAAFFRVANFSLAIFVIAFFLFALLAFSLGRKLAAPFGRMADELQGMSESGDLSVLAGEPVCAEQQRLKSALDHILTDALGTRNDLARLTSEMQQNRSRQPVDLSPVLDPARPVAEFDMVGSSSLIREVREQVYKAAKAGTDVLIWGETGTGKELVAAAIHKVSTRSAGPYVSINCGALDENLLLDALFGHVKGAFTEAKNDRKGAFLAAHGGTLHLDEIANASLKVQQALLRALSVRRIRPLGSDQELAFNTRVVAATNVDLRECVRAGAFREDLYYRLAIISIETPPLRHRKEDIPELAAFCIHDAALALGRPEARLSRGALDLLYAYDWPGNVREFKNCITRAMAFVEGDLILPQYITLEQDAFRTYSKPLSPQVLAERLHPADPSLRRAHAQAAASADPPPVSPRDSRSGAAETQVGGMGSATEFLWPAPPRGVFTPARTNTSSAPAEPPPPQTDSAPDTPPWTAGAESVAAELPEASPVEQPQPDVVFIGSALFPPSPPPSSGPTPESKRPADGHSGAAALIPPPRSIPNADIAYGLPVFSAPGGGSQRAAARQAASQLAAARRAAELGQAGREKQPATDRSALSGFAGRSVLPEGLNERQLQALSHIRQQGGITRSAYEEVAGHDVSARTAQNDLRDLVDRGILKRVGAGPGTRYIPGKAFSGGRTHE